VKRYKSTTILGGGPPGKIVQCQSFKLPYFISSMEKIELCFYPFKKDILISGISQTFSFKKYSRVYIKHRLFYFKLSEEEFFYVQL
jgi:hypothetical protein